MVSLQRSRAIAWSSELKTLETSILKSDVTMKL